MLKSPTLWIAALWVGVMIHLDWHLGRAGHDHRSFDLTYLLGETFFRATITPGSGMTDTDIPVKHEAIRRLGALTVTSKPKGIPDNSSVIIPRLICRDPAGAIEFCVAALGAVELGRRPGPEGSVAHALLTIGPAMIMIEAEWPTLPSRAPSLDGTSPVAILVYVEDVDQTVERAVRLGARVLLPARNQFWGDRTAWIMDPSGHVWTIATRIEEPTEEERRQRWSNLLRDLPET